MSLVADLRRDEVGRFHFIFRQPGTAHHQPTACGVVDGLRSAAWFQLGDHRGRVTFERACDQCLDALANLDHDDLTL